MGVIPELCPLPTTNNPTDWKQVYTNTHTYIVLYIYIYFKHFLFFLNKIFILFIFSHKYSFILYMLVAAFLFVFFCQTVINNYVGDTIDSSGAWADFAGVLAV